jgi:hypothetical protein
MKYLTTLAGNSKVTILWTVSLGKPALWETSNDMYNSEETTCQEWTTQDFLWWRTIIKPRGGDMTWQLRAKMMEWVERHNKHDSKTKEDIMFPMRPLLGIGAVNMFPQE